MNTPGPWKFDRLVVRGVPAPDGLGYIRPENEDGKEIAHHGDTDRTEAENVANGNLIAAAPDLLAALIYFANEYVSDDASCHVGITTKEKCSRCSVILAARAAIAKAKG